MWERGMKDALSRNGAVTTVDEDGTIVAAGPVASGLATSLAFAIAIGVLLVIVIATALTGPAGAAPLADLGDAGRAIAQTPARDVSFVVVDSVVAKGAPAKTMAIVVVAAMLFGVTTVAGMMWRRFARSLVRPAAASRRQRPATR
jgi:hypothetical protein